MEAKPTQTKTHSTHFRKSWFMRTSRMDKLVSYLWSRYFNHVSFLKQAKCKREPLQLGGKNINHYFMTGKIAFGVDSLPLLPLSTRTNTHTNTKFRALQRALLKLSRMTNKHCIFGKAEQTAEATGVHVWQLRCTKTARISQNADSNCDTNMYSHLLRRHKNRHPLCTHGRHADIPLLIAAIIKGFIWISKTWLLYFGGHLKREALSYWTDRLLVWVVCLCRVIGYNSSLAKKVFSLHPSLNCVGKRSGEKKFWNEQWQGSMAGVCPSQSSLSLFLLSKCLSL